jgi:hypothetical protein
MRVEEGAIIAPSQIWVVIKIFRQKFTTCRNFSSFFCGLSIDLYHSNIPHLYWFPTRDTTTHHYLAVVETQQPIRDASRTNTQTCLVSISQ